MKRILVLAILFYWVWLVCCEKGIESTIVTAQVVKTLVLENNTATVILGKTRLGNVFLPQPNDTNFINIFPINVSPITNASVKINDTELTEKVSGVYFKPAIDLQHQQRYNLCIVTEKETIAGSCVLPDSFAITHPSTNDTLLFFFARVVWTKSDSAEHYIISVKPVDATNQAKGWDKNLIADSTSYVIPQETFMDTAGNFYPGEYLISLVAINGAWKKGSLDLFLNGGNLSGALGIFGAAVYAQPVIVNIKSP